MAAAVSRSARRSCSGRRSRRRRRHHRGRRRARGGRVVVTARGEAADQQEGGEDGGDRAVRRVLHAATVSAPRPDVAPSRRRQCGIRGRTSTPAGPAAAPAATARERDVAEHDPDGIGDGLDVVAVGRGGIGRRRPRRSAAPSRAAARSGRPSAAATAAGPSSGEREGGVVLAGDGGGEGGGVVARVPPRSSPCLAGEEPEARLGEGDAGRESASTYQSRSRPVGRRRPRRSAPAAARPAARRGSAPAAITAAVEVGPPSPRLSTNERHCAASPASPTGRPAGPACGPGR